MAGDSTLNNVMVVAALVATVTFASMVQPPGNVISVAAGDTGDVAVVGHAVMPHAGHVGAAKAFLILDYIAFGTALLCMISALACADTADNETLFAAYRLTYWSTCFFLFVSIGCLFAAFAVISFMVFGDVFHAPIMVCTIILGGFVFACAIWAAFGPFSFIREFAACYWNRKHDTYCPGCCQPHSHDVDVEFYKPLKRSGWCGLTLASPHPPLQTELSRALIVAVPALAQSEADDLARDFLQAPPLALSQALAATITPAQIKPVIDALTAALQRPLPEALRTSTARQALTQSVAKALAGAPAPAPSPGPPGGPPPAPPHNRAAALDAILCAPVQEHVEV